jgi:pimeloyl-ACP methyl ester carboxylesterase
LKGLLIFLVGTYLNALSYFSRSYAAHKALSLFAKPRKGHITDVQNKFLSTALKEEFVYKEFKIMTYSWTGPKATILLAHGWESNAGRWKTLTNELLSDGHGIVALDAPAHGNSGSPNFNALLYSEFIYVVAEQFKPETIIGHSVGGMASVFCHNKYRLDHLKKLVLLGSPSEFSDILERYTSLLKYNERIKSQLNIIIYERYGKYPKDFSTAKYLQTIDSQGLIIHDQGDAVIPYKDAEQIKRSFRNSRLITTSGLGHSLNHKTVFAHIHEFLDS